MNKFITSASDLVTTHEQTRTGFLAIALEKNMVGDPYVKQALAFKTMVAHTNGPDDFLNMREIRPFMLTEAGLSEKSLQHLNEEDYIMVIKELIEKFLKPAGEAYIDETVYRFLLTKGDAIGSAMRNRIGDIRQEKFVRYLLSCMSIRGINYWWGDKEQTRFSWCVKPTNDINIEKKIKAIYWENENAA